MATQDSVRGTNDVEVAPQFPVLDTLRAVGALAVLTTHTSFQTGEYLGNGVWGTLLARLDVGVAIFFVLSGFLLARPWIARRALSLPAPGLGTYYEKRALRILPVYVVAVVIGYLVVPGNEAAGVGDWLTSFFFLDSFVGKSLPYGLTHMWSLAVEVCFYVVLPGLMLLVGRGQRRGRSVGIALAAMAVLSIAWLVLVPRVDEVVAGAPGLWLPAYATWFAAGIAVAHAHVQFQAGKPSSVVARVVALGQQPGVCWTLAVGLMLVAATPVAGPSLLEAPTVGEALTKNVLYALVGSLLILSGVFAGPGAYRTVMAWPALRHLGLISYSVFCIHLTVLSVVFDATGIDIFTGHGLRIWIFTVLGSMFAAEVLYRTVETPGMRLRRRLSARDSAAMTTNTPETTATTR